MTMRIILPKYLGILHFTKGSFVYKATVTIASDDNVSAIRYINGCLDIIAQPIIKWIFPYIQFSLFIKAYSRDRMRKFII